MKLFQNYADLPQPAACFSFSRRKTVILPHPCPLDALPLWAHSFRANRMKQTCSRGATMPGAHGAPGTWIRRTMSFRSSSEFRVPILSAFFGNISAVRRQFTLERGLAMTDARREWISKRAYTLWEEAGRPHGHDGDHWEQAVQERDEFERVALAPEARPDGTRKPLIEISKKAQGKKSEAAKPRKKAEAAAEKPIAAKAVAKAKSVKAAANGTEA
jgi:hypothetical protein